MSIMVRRVSEKRGRPRWGDSPKCLPSHANDRGKWQTGVSMLWTHGASNSTLVPLTIVSLFAGCVQRPLLAIAVTVIRGERNMEKKAKPVGVCTSCRETTYDARRINEQCYKRFSGKRCKGVFGSALNIDDWRECSACKATGATGGMQCGECGGLGWHYARRM